MRSLIAAVLLVATLLSVSSSAFAQGAQPIPQPTPQPTPQLTPQPSPQLTPQPSPQLTPQPTPGPTPSTASSSQTTKEEFRAWPEPGWYHPCPSSVGFGNGRSVCLGLDEHVHVARSADGYGYRHHYGYHYGYAVPVFEKNGNAYYGFRAPSYIHTPWPIYAAVPIRPAPIVSANGPGYWGRLGYWGGYGYGWR